MLADQDIVTCGKQKYTSKHGAVPIHRLRVYRLGRWEETEDEEADEEHERDDIDGHSVLAQREARLG